MPRKPASAAEADAGVARNATGYAELVADGDGVVMDTLAAASERRPAGRAARARRQPGSRDPVAGNPAPAVGSVAQAELFGKPGLRVPATLRQLSDTADARTRTFEARYVLQGTLAAAPLGATVTIRIPDDARATPQAGLQVPIGALDGEQPGVWVVAGDLAKVGWRPVTVEHVDDDSARVSAHSSKATGSSRSARSAA